MISKKQTAAQPTQPSDRPQKNDRPQNAKSKHRVRDQILLWGYAVIFGVLAVLTKIFSAALASGDASYFVHAFNYISWENILIFVVVMLVVRWLVGKFAKKGRPELMFTEKPQKVKFSTPNQFFVLTLILTLLSFGLTFLLFYPGTAMNDTVTATFNPYTSTQHPVFFQAILSNLFAFFYNLTGHMALGVAAITALQALVAALIWSYLVRWLRQHNVRLGLCWLAVLFAAFYPVVASFAICVLKDTWFALALLLFLPTAFAVLFDSRPAKTTKVLFVVATLACSLFRSNGFAVILVTLLAMLIYALVKRKSRLVLAVAIGVAIIGQVAVSAFVQLRQIPETTAVESLGVPMAQLAAVIHEYNGEPPTDIISQDDQDFLAQILPLHLWAENYRYSFIDAIKFHKQFDDEFLATHVSDFLAVWARVLTAAPDTYVTAYLAQTYGFWNLAFWDASKYDQTQSIFLSYKNNIDDDWMMASYGFDVANQPRVFSDEFATTARQYFSGTLQNCFALTAGIMIMFVLLVAVLLVIWGQARYLLLLLPIVLTWGTMMVATPASMIYRYNVYLVFTLPMVVFVLGEAARCRSAR